MWWDVYQGRHYFIPLHPRRPTLSPRRVSLEGTTYLQTHLNIYGGYLIFGYVYSGVVDGMVTWTFMG